MATVNFRGSWIARGSHQTVWPSMAGTDVGLAQSTSPLPDKTVSVEGTFDAGTVVIQGSNDGTNWYTLKDPANAAISLAAAGIRAIMENPRYIRPSISGGGGSASLTVTLIERGGMM